MGRPVLSAGELRRMSSAENIANWYQERAKAENWETWASQNHDKATVLAHSSEAWNKINGNT